MARRHHLPTPTPATPDTFWREALGPGMQIATSTERIARLRRGSVR